MIKLKIATKQSRTLRLFINTYVDDHTDINRTLIFLHNIHEIPTWKQYNEYIFKLSDFKVPKWWYEFYKLSEYNKTIMTDYRKTGYIMIQNGLIQTQDEPDSIIIHEISFLKSKTTILAISGCILFLYFLISFFIYLKNRNTIQTLKYKIVAYKNLQENNCLDNEIDKLLYIIGEKFVQKYLTIGKIEQMSGIPSNKIAHLLKNNFSMTFPQYLNIIRYTKAKKLFKTTKLKIIEIANLTGYGSIAHFNRYFKKNEGLTQKKYRKKIEKINTQSDNE